VVAQIADSVDEVLIFSTELKSESPPVYGSIFVLPNPELLEQLVRLLENLMRPCT
jgi:chemotaxis protein CheC